MHDKQYLQDLWAQFYSAALVGVTAGSWRTQSDIETTCARIADRSVRLFQARWRAEREEPPKEVGGYSPANN